jgi:hypothetical protein
VTTSTFPPFSSQMILIGRSSDYCRDAGASGAFIDMFVPHLDDLGLILVKLDRGGYGLIPSTALAVHLRSRPRSTYWTS